LNIGIFAPISVQEMVYLKALQKYHPNGCFCVGKPSVKKCIW